MLPLQSLQIRMPRSRSDDPLITLPLRLPTSVVHQLRAEASAAGVTLSDALRAHLTLAAVKPLGKLIARRRQPQSFGKVISTDPTLLRALASIGSNLNQIARSMNSQNLLGSPIDVLTALVQLRSIEQAVQSLAGSHFPPSVAGYAH